MILIIDCPGCERELRIDSKYAGTYGSCNHCKTRLLVPKPVLVSALHLITTGKIPNKCEILEVCGIQFHPSSGTVLSTFSEKVRPDKNVPGHILRKTELDKSDLENARPISKVLPDLIAWLSEQTVVAAHDATIQKRFIQSAMKCYDGPACEVAFIDLASWAAVQDNAAESVALEALADTYGVAFPVPMRALGCAVISMELLRHFMSKSEDLESDLVAHRVRDIHLESPAWRQEPATESQIEYLFSLGCVPEEGITKGEASDLISRLLDGEIDPDFEIPY